jgi:hypothetical protein
MAPAQALAQNERVLRADRDDQAEAKAEALPSGTQKREQAAIDGNPQWNTMAFRPATIRRAGRL